MAFKPKPQVAEQTVDITVSLPAAHHARLVTVGQKHKLTPEEVLKQFVSWAIETGNLGSKRKKATTKGE